MLPTACFVINLLLKSTPDNSITAIIPGIRYLNDPPPPFFVFLHIYRLLYYVFILSFLDKNNQ